MYNAIKRPHCVSGSIDAHRRAMFGHKTVNEQGYFTRYTTGKAKPKVL